MEQIAAALIRRTSYLYLHKRPGGDCRREWCVCQVLEEEKRTVYQANALSGLFTTGAMRAA
jgi:hypothetical protein